MQSGSPSSLNVVLFENHVIGWGLSRKGNDDWPAVGSTDLFKSSFSIDATFQFIKHCFLVSSTLYILQKKSYMYFTRRFFIQILSSSLNRP